MEPSARGAERLVHRVERLFGGATPAFRAQVVAPFVVSLAALLGLGLGLVAVGLLVEARDRRSGLAAGG